MENGEMIKIEVAYARPDTQLIIPLQVKAGTTALEAIKLSGIEQKFSAKLTNKSLMIPTPIVNSAAYQQYISGPTG